MSFFDSEVVRAEMTEIQELQEEVYSNVFKFPSMNMEEKKIPCCASRETAGQAKGSLYKTEFV